MLPNASANLPIQPLMEHSYMALAGSAAMILVAVLLVVWTIVFYQSAARSPIFTFSTRRQENLCRLLKAYRQRLLSLEADRRYHSLDPYTRQVVLGKILANLAKQYYRTAGWANYRPQQLMATDWPQMASLISRLLHPGAAANHSLSEVPSFHDALYQVDIRLSAHQQSLTARHDLVIKPPKRSRLWIIPVTLVVVSLIAASGLQTRNWFLEQQALRADRAGNISQAQLLRVRQTASQLVADRWLVNYNLGTSYLEAGNLVEANTYLSRSSKQVPFLLEARLTEPQTALAGCQVNYNLALAITKAKQEKEENYSLDEAAELLVYCNQEALKARQKSWETTDRDPGNRKVTTRLKKLSKDADLLIAQIKELGGKDFVVPSPEWL
ncbi:hypothetical protein [Varibaculum prostatecancerukia]|uniref:hypothetical protein n=1 Tax=Varibaculum prostatecancerukia TaxID=2811781 RepID=UPI002868DF28|nr:hypothetical protein [Varibaculum prostatecancerukia]